MKLAYQTGRSTNFLCHIFAQDNEEKNPRTCSSGKVGTDKMGND